MAEPKRRTVYKSKYTGNVYNTAREAAIDNRNFLTAQRLAEQTKRIPATYIGGNIDKARATFWKQEPVMQHAVDSIANRYGIDSSALKYRLDKEGFVDGQIKVRNNPDFESYRGYDLLHTNNTISGVEHFGLDDVATLIEQGKVKPINENWWDVDFTNEKGRQTHGAHGTTVADNIGLMAATLKYFTDEARKDNPNLSNYDANRYGLAYYNRGVSGGKKWATSGAKGYDYRRSLEDGRNKKLKGGTVYTVQKGDTLSDIARLYAGDINRYLQIANANNINNPDLIEVGQKITIPEKFDKPLKFEDIPTNNRISVIDDFSPNYNYIIEGNKIYYSRKGNNDYWVDISDNDTARKNLFNHIASKYNYKGYEDNEKAIGEQVLSGTYDYKKAIKPKRRFSLEEANFEPADAIEQPSSTFAKRIDRNTTEVPREATTYLGDAINAITDLYQKGTNYVSRQYEKLFGDKDATSTLEMPKEVKTDSKYNIMPQSYTGDTINVDKNKYIIPESINLNDVRLGIRNRGSREAIDTEGAIITNFNPYTPYNKVSKSDKTATYMGIDKDGNFKVGTIDKFSDGDMLTRTFANDVTSFAKDKKGNQIWKDDSAHGNRGRNVPVINVIENGKVKQGSLNILTDKGSSKSNTYGNITGGRVVLEAGNERRLVSGSIDDIEKQFNDLKTRHGVESVKIYTLDNGSYNRGLRTRNKKLTAKDLQAYDNQNRGGGNFMYLLNGNAFTTDTVTTPNIRTVNSESYKQGHPLTNEQKGVVLHHTAFEEDDLTNVTRHLTNPNTEASSHVIIGYNGHRRTLASPDKVTFHAGESVWNNRQNVNDFMLGIEFQGDTNKKDLTDSQIKSAIEYLRPIIRKNNIPLENIVTHEQVRAMYNDFAKRQGKRLAANKPDINQKNYTRIIDALLKSLYYPKRQLKYGGAVLSIN